MEGRLIRLFCAGMVRTAQQATHAWAAGKCRKLLVNIRVLGTQGVQQRLSTTGVGKHHPLGTAQHGIRIIQKRPHASIPAQVSYFGVPLKRYTRLLKPSAYQFSEVLSQAARGCQRPGPSRRAPGLLGAWVPSVDQSCPAAGQLRGKWGVPAISRSNTPLLAH